MADEGEASPARAAVPADASNNLALPVTSLGQFDVLLGKGSGYHEYCGNQSFLSLIEERKHAYNKATKNKEKARLAKEFLEHLRSLGGRFLKRGENSQPVASVVEDGIWYEADEKAALEKIKQAFRQNRDYKRFQRKEKRLKKDTPGGEHNKASCSQNGHNRLYDASQSSSADMVTNLPNVDFGPRTACTKTEDPTPGDGASVMPLISLGNGGCPVVDYTNLFPLDGPHLALAPPFGTCRQIGDTTPANGTGHNVSTSIHLNATGFASSGMPPRDFCSRNLADSIRRTQSPKRQADKVVTSSTKEEAMDPFDATLGEVVASTTGSPVLDDEASLSSPTLGEDEESEFALSVLGLSNHPKCTNEQLEQEKLALTDEEQEGVLSDLFGRRCCLEPPKKKKAKRDLDSNETKGYLLEQMRAELDSIPNAKKPALLDAQTKCRREEFSDSRLGQFLRADEMNPKLAAQRFVNYWASRRELFGLEKYCLQMTLSEALRDDLVALEAGVCSILPHPDVSGRPLFLYEPTRNTGKGYTAESLTRSVWYLMEIMVREYAKPDGNFIWIVQDKDSTVWDFDLFYISRIPYYHRYCWPIREMPSHSCCSNVFMRRVVKPVIIATMGKAGRCRVMIHDVPESELVQVLTQYGIRKEMLPTSMGGSVDLNVWIAEFIAQRRAIEMEELS